MKRIDKEAAEEARKLSVLNRLTREEFSQLSREALSLEGEGCMMSKMFSIFEKRQAEPLVIE